ncbi:hypothetical protein BDW74DRAFT_172578 [Aspergillus multicolor]|uniref:uncharacterized protein n=1 Tax=Aspergillus multicolor TaxID=41759 RepID=UPI003CCDB88D
MPSWTHLIRFVAEEDNKVHLGQLVDTTRDVGQDSLNGMPIAAYLINGTVFDGEVTKAVMHVKQVAPFQHTSQTSALLSPVSREECNFIRCLGLNYVDHAKEASLPLPEAPILFTKPRTALSDPYPATINIPACAQDGTSDYEAELCLVIGKTGRDIPEDNALNYVLGYTAANDVSARKLQMLTAQWSFSKGLDGSCPIGPVLVAPSVISDPQTLSVQAIHNGDVVQDGHTRDMIFSIRKQIAYLSQGTTLEAGTLILTGTPAGIGYFRNPRVVLRHGDEISVRIGQIGTLVNTVRDSLLRHSRRHSPNPVIPPAPDSMVPLDRSGSIRNRTDSGHEHNPPGPVVPCNPQPLAQEPTAAPYFPPLPVQGTGSLAVGDVHVDFGAPALDSWAATAAASAPAQGYLDGPATSAGIGLGIAPGPSYGPDNQLPSSSWFADANFNLDAFNTAIMSAAYCYPQTSSSEELAGWAEHLGASLSQGQGSPLPQSEQQPRQQSVEELVQRNWFTLVGEFDFDPISPSDAHVPLHVDEPYREHLAAVLQNRLPSSPLPSTDFLNLCIQMYFTRFHPVFPVLHAPSFRPSANRSLLLLSISSLGSLFLGSTHAVSQGKKIFKTLNKAVLSTWERYVAAGSADTVSMVQAALLGQTYGILSKDVNDLLIAQTFHGTMIAWARRFNLFQARCASDAVTPELIASDPEKAWKTWIHAEERTRIAAGLHLHDVELAEISQTDTFLRNFPAPVSTDILWSAPTAQVWAASFSSSVSRTPSSSSSPARATTHSAPRPTPAIPLKKDPFHTYLELQGLAARIIRDTQSQTQSPRPAAHVLTPQQQEDHTVSLIHFHQSTLTPTLNQRRSLQNPTHQDPYFLRILWHSLFISLFTNFNRLELAIGREGPHHALQDGHREYVREWAGAASTPASVFANTTSHGARAVLHASCILRALEATPLRVEPPIHVPRVLFRAALVCFCYARDGGSSSHGNGNGNGNGNGCHLRPRQGANSDINAHREAQLPGFPELDVLARDGGLGPSLDIHIHMVGSRGSVSHGQGHQNPSCPPQQRWAAPSRESAAVTFRGLVDVLQRVGHWGVSRSYAAVLGLLFPELEGVAGEAVPSPLQ